MNDSYIFALPSGRRFFVDSLPSISQAERLKSDLCWNRPYTGPLRYAEMSPAHDSLAELIWLYGYDQRTAAPT